MGISFELVITNLKALHRVYETRNLKFPVHLTRVGDGTTQDTDFLSWCRSLFPLFQPMCRPCFDWLGKTYAMDVGRAPPGCSQWYALNFLANGREALCYIDDDGRFGKGDAHHQNALNNVYNHPLRLALREKKLRSLHPRLRGMRRIALTRGRAKNSALRRHEPHVAKGNGYLTMIAGLSTPDQQHSPMNLPSPCSLGYRRLSLQPAGPSSVCVVSECPRFPLRNDLTQRSVSIRFEQVYSTRSQPFMPSLSCGRKRAL